MDYKFPHQLFPHFYLNGPPTATVKHDYGDWGSYGQLLETSRGGFQSGVRRETQFLFQPQRKVDGEVWVPTEPIVTPLLPPTQGIKQFWDRPVSPNDFPEHLQYFYVHHCMDSFSVMGNLLGEHFSFARNCPEGVTRMGKMRGFLRSLKYKNCDLLFSERVNRYHQLLGDVLPDIPSSLLAELLHEELIHQKELNHFQPATTGGALACLPNPECQNEAFLIYPSGEALNSINFHLMQLEFSDDKPSVVNMVSKPLVFNLEGAVRQVSVAQVDDEAYLGLRSDRFCAAWVMQPRSRPRPLEVVQLNEQATSLNISPHISGELVVASESGAVHLWVVGKGLQKVRDEKTNLYFNAKSSWRWCEFAAHPRMLVYADRTGAELTDIRSSDCHTLFRIGETAACKSGERIVLGKYLTESHGFHHLVTTQFSAYLLDERMPCVPVLKWEHMMASPPCFAHVVPALGQSNTSKILLGAQTAQETMLLQYSGGRERACQADGLIQKLYSPCESLKIQQLPHRRHTAQARLDTRAAGLTATQNNGFMCVLQLTEAGDIFYQILKHFDSIDSHSESVKPTSNTDSVLQSRVFLGHDSDDERERDQRMLSPIVFSDCDVENGSRTSDEHQLRIPSEKGINSEPLQGSAKGNNVHPVRPAMPKMASRYTKLVWKKWLESLLMEAAGRNSHWRHRKLKTSDIMQWKTQKRDKLEEDKFQRLRKDQAEILKTRKLLVHGVTYLPRLELTPVPDEVDPEDWPDDLSRRISASWQDGWSDWWHEKLGLNRDAKIEALRRKRRQAKRARNRVALSSSFTSSMSYQDDLSDWSSATSQYLGSNAESVYNSQSAPEDETISDLEILDKSPGFHRSFQDIKGSSDMAVETFLKTSQTVKNSEQDKATSVSHSPPIDLEQQLSQATSVKSTSVLLSSSVSSLKVLRTNHSELRWWQHQQQQEDFSSSLFGSSQEPGQDTEASTSFGLVATRSSSFLSPSRASLRTFSQNAQPQKKKSRMGF
ncbi:TATA box-binding protein-associated factor RNA polymerase I subunit C isoform X1 [Clarias gariepinus]|uniref:TATA box-binding protein-associated factor RNA polymerase I subunit C isoform X1 n=2 Tax=Clarias gariepinus TaxID=13013 RepID=UPI00234C39B9|nr:TATA box-binding protein-associated factor RNA polymerase I subunit C isoform X1 [Clarias gariepinus]